MRGAKPGFKIGEEPLFSPILVLFWGAIALMRQGRKPDGHGAVWNSQV